VAKKTSITDDWYILWPIQKYKKIHIFSGKVVRTAYFIYTLRIYNITINKIILFFPTNSIFFYIYIYINTEEYFCPYEPVLEPNFCLFLVPGGVATIPTRPDLSILVNLFCFCRGKMFLTKLRVFLKLFSWLFLYVNIKYIF